MPWRHFIRVFTNNPQLIQRLSETKTIRAAARIAVYWFNEAKYEGKEALKNYKEKSPNESADTGRPGFLQRFKNELQIEMRKAEEINKHNESQTSRPQTRTQTSTDQSSSQRSTERNNMNEFKTRSKQKWEEPSHQQKRKGRA